MKPTLTPNELIALQRLFRAVWDQIGADCLAAYREEEDGSLSRATVVELVLDADRPEMYVKQNHNPTDIGIDHLQQALKTFRQLPYSAQVKLATGGFQFSRYNW